MTDKPASTSSLRELLEAVAAGKLDPSAAEKQLLQQQIADLGFATLDLQRQARRGRPEVIFAQGKTTDQVLAIANAQYASGQTVIITRLYAEKFDVVRSALSIPVLAEHREAGFLQIGNSKPTQKEGIVAVLAAGTSDLPVAEEAALTAEALGSPVERAYDVGVAGLHRLLRRAELLLKARVIITVAGMEGALPSVVSGLVRCPVVAVPTSVGYGANFGGMAALLTMLNGCSPGVSVVNIDNGFGAGYLADLMNGM